MSDYIKYMYREYLEGRTRIKKVNEDQPLFPNTGAGLLIQKNKLTDDWTALNVSDGHYEEESFNHEALAAAFLQGANMGQLRMLNEILDRARLNGPYCLENVADALLSFAPACKAESLMENPMLHFIELSKSFSKNGGIYDPVHGIYIDSKVNGMGDSMVLKKRFDMDTGTCYAIPIAFNPIYRMENLAVKDISFDALQFCPLYGSLIDKKNSFSRTAIERQLIGPGHVVVRLGARGGGSGGASRGRGQEQMPSFSRSCDHLSGLGFFETANRDSTISFRFSGEMYVASRP